MATITFPSTLQHHPTPKTTLLWPPGVCLWVKVGQMRSPDVGGQPNNSRGGEKLVVEGAARAGMKLCEARGEEEGKRDE